VTSFVSPIHPAAVHPPPGRRLPGGDRAQRQLDEVVDGIISRRRSASLVGDDLLSLLLIPWLPVT